MDQEAEGTAHGFTIQEAAAAASTIVIVTGIGILFDDGAEVGYAVFNHGIEIWNEGLEPLRSAMAGEIEGEAGEAVLGQEDGGGLEGPADVVAIAMDHEHKSTRS